MPAPTVVGRVSSRLAAALALAAMTTMPLSAQSLGELAKMEEERRKAIKSSGKVYTNESIRAQPGSRPAATPAGSTPAGTVAPAPPPSPSGVQPPSPSGVQPPSASGAQLPAGAASSPGSPDAAEPKKDEAYWKGRIQAERDALQRAEVFAEALQSRINALSTDFVNRDDPAQRAVIATDRQKALAELDRVRQEIQQHTKAIPAIQDEARRAGVPPGWLR